MTTTAIGSPTKRTTSNASGHVVNGGANGDGIGTSPRSAAVKMPITPGIDRASSTSTPAMRACAMPERT